MQTRNTVAPRYVPLGLGLTMAALVALAVLQGTAGTSSGVPAPSQYGGSGSTVPYGGLGTLGLGILVAAIAVAVLMLLFLMLRRRGKSGAAAGAAGAGAEDENADDSGAGTDGDGEAPAVEDAGEGAGSSDYAEEPPGDSGGSGGSAAGSDYDEGSPDLDDTLGELDKLAETANTKP